METGRKIRITNPTGKPGDTRVQDAVTGEDIDRAYEVTFSHNVTGIPNCQVKCHFPAIDVIVAAEFDNTTPDFYGFYWDGTGHKNFRWARSEQIMSYHVHFDLNGRKKTISVSLNDGTKAIDIVKAMFPEGKDFTVSRPPLPEPRPLPLSAPPEQVKEAEKPKIIKP
jgi:hypothetical protein